MSRREVRDNELLEKLDRRPRRRVEASLFRVVRDGRAPDQCGRPGGRWDDGTFDVLYTAQTPDGAISEIRFHLAKGQPVFPSRADYRLFELHVRLEACMHFATLDEFALLGLDTANFGQLSYADRILEYPRLQEVAEHASFLGADGICVPSARWQNSNFVLFCEALMPGSIEVVRDHGLVNWDEWMGRSSPRK